MIVNSDIPKVKKQLNSNVKSVALAFKLSSLVYLIFVSILILILYWQVQPFTYSYEPAWATVVATNRDYKEILDYEYVIDDKKYWEGLHSCRDCEVGNLKRIYYRVGNPAVTFNSEPPELFASAFLAAAIGLFVFPTVVTLIFCFRLSSLTSRKAKPEAAMGGASVGPAANSDNEASPQVPKWLRYGNYFSATVMILFAPLFIWIFVTDTMEHGFKLANFLQYLAMVMFFLGKLIFHQLLIKNSDRKDHSWAKKLAVSYYLFTVLLYAIARNIHHWLK